MTPFNTQAPLSRADCRRYKTVNGFATTPTGIMVETYLTEEMLGRILVLLSGAREVLQQPQVIGTRMRYDYRIMADGTPFFVEFDGDSHFRDANVVFRDRLKDMTSEKAGAKVVRIPYFVQLTTDTFKHFFGFAAPFTIETSFPHGFITSKMTPASFCMLGLDRYEKIITALPKNVSAAISSSLNKKIQSGMPKEFVIV